MILGPANLNDELFVEIMTRLADHIPWREFVQRLQRNSKGDRRSGFLLKLFEALEYTYNLNWRTVADYVSPCCFMYLIERFLLLTPRCRTGAAGCIFGTKSSFIEWLISVDANYFPNVSFMVHVEEVHKFIASVLGEFVLNQNGTKEWIRKSNLDVKNYFPVLLLRLVVLVCLLHLMSGDYIQLIHDLLGKNYITSQLPLEFVNVLQKGRKKGRKRMDLEFIAEAFKVIDNPLIVVRLDDDSAKIVCPDAMILDLWACRDREFILQTLFPNIVDDVGVETASATVESSDATSDVENVDMIHLNSEFWVLLENLQLSTHESYFHRLPISMIKGFFDPWIQFLTCPIQNHFFSYKCPIQNPNELLSKNETEELVGLYDEIKHLLEALNTRENHILSRRPIVEPLFQRILVYQNNVNVEEKPSQASLAAEWRPSIRRALSNVVSYWDCLWDYLEKLQLSTDESCLNRVLPNSIIIKDILDPCLRTSTSIVDNATDSFSKTERVEMVCFHHKLLQLRDALSRSESVTENHIKLSKQILSRRLQLAPILYLPCFPYNSQGGVDSGHENINKNNKGKRKKSKINKGGK